ncbi:MAG TPA: hypothetical protein VFW90_02395, partial [Candidatus Saccharimonadales bacterium]|nr:hypothetical protein [Candidatus Saccharimonadales bacterium]
MSWRNTMENTNWLKQASDQPLFSDTLWSRPENRRLAGKLQIFGGHAQSFNDVSLAYSSAGQAGIGTAHVLLPDKLQNILRNVFPEAEYAPSTPIGSFSRQALGSWLDSAGWADATLLAGDFGRNSETAILLDSFADKYPGKLALSGDSLDVFLPKPAELLLREGTLIVSDLPRIQKLAQPDSLIKQTDDLAGLVRRLSEWSAQIKSAVITEHREQLIVAYQGRVSTTPAKRDVTLAELAAY